jgi:hypothetical protein
MKYEIILAITVQYVLAATTETKYLHMSEKSCTNTFGALRRLQVYGGALASSLVVI